MLSSVAGQFQAGGYLGHFLRTAIGGEANNAPRDQILTAGKLSHGAWQDLVVGRGGVGDDMAFFAYTR